MHACSIESWPVHLQQYYYDLRVKSHYNNIICVYLCLQALATLKQKIRKYNKDFETGIEAYRQNPVESDEEGEEGEDDERDEGKGQQSIADRALSH